MCKERIAYEKMIIDDLLESLELCYISSQWDGFKLKVLYEFDHSTECTRNDMIEYLPEIDYSSGDDLGSVEDLAYLLSDNSDLGKSQRRSERDYPDYEYDGYSEDLYD